MSESKKSDNAAKARPRPLSPHLQVYRLQITSLLSISHRAAGVFLFFGSLVLVYWIAALAGGAETYAQFKECLTSTLGKVVVSGSIIALYYHFFNGLRHLAWDFGYGFEMRNVRITGWLTILVVLGLSVMTIGYLYCPTTGVVQ